LTQGLVASRQKDIFLRGALLTNRTKLITMKLLGMLAL
jgi:hypothetical protein